jgi:predicted lipoprotein with Yx(FWY)xxD motif
MNASIPRSATLAALVAAAALGLAACGGDDDDDDSGSGTASGGGVAVESIDGTDVLVDSQGRALYSADQEDGGEVLCTAGCTSIWDPIPASHGDAAPADLELGEVERPDGEMQLTYEGRPLYAFTEEGPGELTGDGFVDSFDGTRFSWTAATAPGGSGSGESGSAGSAGSDDSAGVPGY